MKILLIIYDNEAYINIFPIGIAYIASYLKKQGHEVCIYNQDIYHYPEEHLTNYLNENKFDIIGLVMVAGYYQYRKLLKISEAISKSKFKPIFILGGAGPTPEPKFFLRKTNADFIVLGEGEKTIVDLINNLQSPENVKGIAFLKDNKLVITQERELIKNIDDIFYPLWELFPIEHYVLMREPGIKKQDRFFPMLSSRGCSFNCNFCFRLMKGFRLRSASSIVEEIKILKQKYYINSIDFIDELFMSSEQRTLELCGAFLKNNLQIKWMCNGRLNYAKKEILEMMKKSGCIYINYGIECLDNIVLKNMNKKLTVEQIYKGVENTYKLNVNQGLNIIWGNIGDNEKTLKRGVKFIKKYSNGCQMRTIRPVTPYPGSPLYYYAIEKGLLKDVGDFYKKHTNSDLLSVNFTSLSDKEFYKQLKIANTELIKDYYKKNQRINLNQCKNLYDNLDSNFRGFRQL